MSAHKMSLRNHEVVKQSLPNQIATSLAILTPRNDGRGFTLIELMVAISIVAILSAIGLTLFTSVQKSARNAKISMDFDAMYKNIEQARISQNKTLLQLTGNGCSECACRGSDTLNCLSVMTSSYTKVTNSQLPTDPWGRPYIWDENEGESGPTDCRKDAITSTGPDNIHFTSDDQSYSVPLSGYLGCN